MKIIRKIRIDGKNWNDIISLPCFSGLVKEPDGKGGTTIRVIIDMRCHVNSDIYKEAVVKAVGGHVIDTLEKLDKAKDIGMMLQSQCEAVPGDVLAEYENHRWSVEKAE